ncbi:uncharacterized protein B4U79_17596 [Dinothrombium tinctorium]|uniref:Metalloendopeptidase n=1 Tax=Dinothrombium tinctorium TaxID=1965070 RepID=A0A443R5R5_9ACAR|nr:uncharacterized protein B4U79_17598 [Dinothrombium tinctorium]RWS10619.1 uncharacterized protein B4U79_17596 [Dinothrombium tinctorium]
MENGRILIEFYTRGALEDKHHRIIYLATTKISQHTCISYAPLTGNVKLDEFHLLFIKGNNICHAWKPNNYRKELRINIENCKDSIANYMHVLMHTLNFYHENQRADAEKYVRINWENIRDEHLEGFKRFEKEDWETYTNITYSQLFPYDYKSLLHLSTLSGKYIEYKNRESIKTNWDLSDIDEDELNFFYNCANVKRSMKNLNETLNQDEFCYRINSSKINLVYYKCVKRENALFTRSFQKLYPRFTTRTLTETHWHLNFGRTPSILSDNESDLNFYLHLGNSRYSYYFEAPPVTFIRIYTIRQIYFAPFEHGFCLAFTYKMWGDGKAILEVGEALNQTYWSPIAAFSYDSNDDPEYSEWKTAIIFLPSLKFGRYVNFSFAGSIYKGGNIGLDNITVSTCSFNEDYINLDEPNVEFPNILNSKHALISNYYHREFSINEKQENIRIRKCCGVMTYKKWLLVGDCVATGAKLHFLCDFATSESKLYEVPHTIRNNYKRCCQSVFN